MKKESLVIVIEYPHPGCPITLFPVIFNFEDTDETITAK